MTEKTVKAPAKSPTKVFDVAKPARQVPADANSRPVIVSNRPIMQDPMMVNQESAAEPASKPAPTATKVVIKPLTDAERLAEEKPAESPAAPEADKSSIEEPGVKKSDNPMADLPIITLDDLPIAKASAKPKKADIDQQSPAPAAPEAVEPVSDMDSAGEAPEARREAALKPSGKTGLDEPTATDITAEPAQKTPVSQEPVVRSTIDDITASVEVPKGDKMTLELEAEAKQQIILDELIGNKTYFLPLNSVEKRRDKIAAGLGVVLIVALGFLLLDLLMDVGAVHITGIEPPIKFFSN